jgi:hypothetical protein
VVTATGRDEEIGISDDGQYRVIERHVNDGRPEYWLQQRRDGRPDGDWQDVRGPIMQRARALRRLRPDQRH